MKFDFRVCFFLALILCAQLVVAQDAEEPTTSAAEVTTSVEGNPTETADVSTNPIFSTTATTDPSAIADNCVSLSYATTTNPLKLMYFSDPVAKAIRNQYTLSWLTGKTPKDFTIVDPNRFKNILNCILKYPYTYSSFGNAASANIAPEVAFGPVVVKLGPLAITQSLSFAVYRHGNDYTIAIRGTNFLDAYDDVTDLNTTPMSYSQIPQNPPPRCQDDIFGTTPGGCVHSGYYWFTNTLLLQQSSLNSYKTLVEFLNAERSRINTLTITGHSLGGAVGTILAQWLSDQVKLNQNNTQPAIEILPFTINGLYTFGSPASSSKTFNKNLRSNPLIKSIYAVVGIGDPIPIAFIPTTKSHLLNLYNSGSLPWGSLIIQPKTDDPTINLLQLAADRTLSAPYSRPCNASLFHPSAIETIVDAFLQETPSSQVTTFAQEFAFQHNNNYDVVFGLSNATLNLEHCGALNPRDAADADHQLLVELVEELRGEIQLLRNGLSLTGTSGTSSNGAAGDTSQTGGGQTGGSTNGGVLFSSASGSGSSSSDGDSGNDTAKIVGISVGSSFLAVLIVCVAVFTYKKVNSNSANRVSPMIA